MPDQARGSFDVKLAPQAADEWSADGAIGRLSLDKQYHGDLEATSKGQMLAHSSSVKGSAGYVAIEKVTGSLKGRRGAFVLLHRGVMTRGTPELTVTVVPDSGTDELAGLSGTLDIIIEAGKHSYVFTYAFDVP
jgi:hypothetical protein